VSIGNHRQYRGTRLPVVSAAARRPERHEGSGDLQPRIIDHRTLQRSGRLPFEGRILLTQEERDDIACDYSTSFDDEIQKSEKFDNFMTK
jgi:hypothetical protein